MALNSELLKIPASNPPTTAVIMPAMGGKPLAFAMPRHSGKAMSETKNPATRFALIACERVPVTAIWTGVEVEAAMEHAFLVT